MDLIIAQKGLTRGALQGATCFYMDDDGVTLVAEFSKHLPRSRVPGQPKSVELGDSSMTDGLRALVAKW